jgi:putative transposase
MTYAFIREECSDMPVVVSCRVMNVSTSGYYQRRSEPVTAKEADDAAMTATIRKIWMESRHSYGSPRVHAELVLGRQTRCSHQRVERLMRAAGIEGIHRRRNRGGTRRDSKATPNPDLVERAFDPAEPNRLWCMDVTEHPTGTGKIYLAVVLDAFSRRVVGWSIADHIRAELVADALDMATLRRRPGSGETIAHSDHGSVYTSWLFGHRIRDAGLLGSMGSIGDCFDNSVIESFFGSLQNELLDEHRWPDRDTLARAIFEWIEAWYNPRRRHSYCGYLSPVDYETAHAA